MFSKKQIETLREGLDVNIDSDGNPSNLGSQMSTALNKPGVDRVTFDAEALTSTEPKPTLTLPIRNGQNPKQAVDAELTRNPDLVKALERTDADIEVVKQKENVEENLVRYSKKELNTILFR